MNIRIGLVGNNIGYSLSPRLHGIALEALGLDGEYSLLDTEPSQLPGLMDKLRSSDWAGVNVTIPYKRVILPLVDVVDESAGTVGAVNTIVSSGGKLTGYNTDVFGLARDLERLRIGLEGGAVAILGAGGGAAAALALARKSRAVIVCRREGQGLALAHSLGVAAQVLPWETPPPRCDVLINCTPPQSDWKALAARAEIIYDLNYHDPCPPPGDYHSGLGMLIYQAAEAFRLWTGHFPVQVMAAAAGLQL